MGDDDLPALPYGRPANSGWSGSDTSRDRALAADADGTTTARQRTVLAHLRRYGAHGLTWKELAALIGYHHGQASGVLSNLHHDGHVARLAETRDRCKIYCHPGSVNGRDTEAYGRKAPEFRCETCGSTTHDTIVHDPAPVPAAVMVDHRITAVLDVWARRDRFGRTRAQQFPGSFANAVVTAYHGDVPAEDDGLFPA